MSPRSGDSLTSFDDAAAVSLITRMRDDPDCSTAVAEILGELAEANNAVLRGPLSAYFSEGNSVAAAQALGVHPQTMRYRLRRIREITQRDPTTGTDRFWLELSLRLSGPA